MRPNFGQFAPPLAAILLTAVTTAHAVVGLAAFGPEAPSVTRIPDRLPAGSPWLGCADRPGDTPAPADPDEDRGDLGFQPVLLLDRVIKPAVRVVPVHTPVLPADGLTPPLTTNAAQYRYCVHDAEVMPRPPRLRTGLALLPHGPPALRA